MVYMDHYTSRERVAHGKRLARARAVEAECRRVAALMAQSAAAEGVPETVISEELGVDRMTVRKWVGKR
jgi:hypothetical protein